MIKKWHLFALVTILFCCSFYVINLKFDKFYRVNGINNDNRTLIEEYLSEEEQDYLIENQLDINIFIDYIEYDQFQLKNYRFYQLLEESGRYLNKKSILEVGNDLSSQLQLLVEDKSIDYAQTLIQNHLEDGFLNNQEFNFDYLTIYISIKPLYDDNTYIEDVEDYVELLKQRGNTKQSTLNNIFQSFSENYTKDSLKVLMNKAKNQDLMLVLEPTALNTIVNKTNYIGSYEPKDLKLISDIPRMRYSMYLESKTYESLEKMYQAIKKEYSGFLLNNCYKSYTLMIQTNKSLAGFNEYQLGNTVDITQSGVLYNEFDSTEMSNWLQEHAHEYGFILRYPKHKASITQHAYNPHTYRYVGTELAKILYDEGLTLEEYNAKNKD